MQLLDVSNRQENAIKSLAKETYVNVRASWDTKMFSNGKMYVGDYAVWNKQMTVRADDGRIWYDVTLPDGSKGFVREDCGQPVKVTAGEKDAQSITDKLIETDRQVHDYMLSLSREVEVMKSKGYDVSRYEKQIAELASRHAERQKILDNKEWFAVKDGVSSLWNSCKEYYNKLMSFIGVGAVPAIIVVAIAAAIVGGASTALIYWSLKPKWEQANVDLSKYKEIQKLLDEMKQTDPERAKKVEDEIRDATDDAYNDGKEDGNLGGMWTIIKPILFAGVGFWAVTKFIDSQSKKKKK